MVQWPAIRLILGLSICTLGGTMMYLYFKNKDEDDDENFNDEKAIAKKKDVLARLTISNENVPTVVGKGGCNIKIIEEKTRTVIRFREKDDDNQHCEISGPAESVEEAKAMLLKNTLNSSIVNEEIFVPQTACGKIIGRCGESLQEICRLSHAKVSVDSGDRSLGNDTRRVVISGSRKEVNTAKKLIQDKIFEDIELRKGFQESDQKQSPQQSPTNNVSETDSSMTLQAHHKTPGQALNIDKDGNPMEVYVSAIASPSKFWVQVVGPQLTQLDELVEDMFEYYNKEENQEKHRIADPYLGQIVAALFKYDGKWYRAEIVGILPNEFHPRDVVLDLYFVDYGDSEYVAPHEVFALKSDFLSLKFQALECFLADVKPASSSWDQQSISRFEELTHVARSRSLTSRIVTYKQRPKGTTHKNREGIAVPGIQLFDSSEGTQLDIGEILVAEDYAVPEEADNMDSPNTSGLENSNSRSYQNSNGQKSDSNENLESDHSSNDAKQHQNRKITTLEIDLATPKESSERLLNAEKLNGNIVQDNGNDLIDNQSQWNRLVQS